ncbi:MAG: pyroglutamyl-peptidase I [Candidatus Eremiobacteraeota bacterium]|nr:pyroglutamyl-peptidase I [Candidatus Eremiobacteraeota bacterium]
MAKHVLITAFEPFGGEKVNPSEMVARSLEGRLIAGRLIVTRVFAVETRNVRERLERAIADTNPDVVVAMGQAGGRNALALERIAMNVLDFDQPDNVGVMRKNEQIVRGGSEARLSNLPFEKIIEAWNDNGVPGYVSNSAGTYVCNQTLYELIGLGEQGAPPLITGFVHLPYLPAQAITAGAGSTPSMSLDLMKRAMELLIETVVPWVDQRTPDRGAIRKPGAQQMWIPRGVKEVER